VRRSTLRRQDTVNAIRSDTCGESDGALQKDKTRMACVKHRPGAFSPPDAGAKSGLVLAWRVLQECA